MILKDNARFWDVRFDVPTMRSIKMADGSMKEYESKTHKLACVAAPSIAEAISLVLAQWPNVTIWQAVNHGRECSVLIAEGLQ